MCVIYAAVFAEIAGLWMREFGKTVVFSRFPGWCQPRRDDEMLPNKET